MSELLSTVTGAGKAFRIEDRVAGSIAAGVTGDILTLNVPGKLIRLYALGCSTTVEQAGMSLTRDGFLLADQLKLIDTTPTNSGVLAFGVNRSPAQISASRAGVFFYEVTGETIVLNKNAGNTTEIIDYAYEVGVFE